MYANTKIREKLLYEIWREKRFSDELKTNDDQKIEIIDAGELNSDSGGPDFLNSRIKIGNITYLGDIEIDIWHSDWKAHGHYIDKKYNKVILHIVFSKERFQPKVYTQDGRKVNSVCLMDFLNENLGSTIKKAILAEKNNRLFVMPCNQLANNIPGKMKLNFVAELGVERFKQKEKRIFERLKELVYLKQMQIREPVVHYDFGEEFQNKKFTPGEFSDPLIWQQLIYEMIFEALGYSKNKDIMIRMAKAVNLEFLLKFKEQENFPKIIESALFNVSGLIPEKLSGLSEVTIEYLRHLVETWAAVKDNYDGTYFTEEKWHFFKLRPQNFPTVRLAGAAQITEKLLKHNLLKNILDAFIKGTDQRKLISYLRNSFVVKANGFWKSHYVFKKEAKEDIKYFVGLSRADGIIINVILPVAAVYFDIFDNKDAARSVKSLYLTYNQKSSNKIVNQVSNTLQLKNVTGKSVYYQGMIELFRHYCVKEKCLECKIGEEVFDGKEI